MNYATLISGPQYHQRRRSFTAFQKVEAGKLLDCHLLRRQHYQELDCGTRCELTDEDILESRNILLNSGLNGLTMEQINLDVIIRMKGQAGERQPHVDVVPSEAVAEAIRSGEEAYSRSAPKVADEHFQISRTELSGAKAVPAHRNTEQKRPLRETYRGRCDSDKKNRFRSTSEVISQVQSDEATAVSLMPIMNWGWTSGER